MTWNKDRKQTKYGHKRQEQMTHITEPWHNSPLLKGSSRALTVPSGRGGWALWRPLRTNTDKNTGRGPPEWNRQTGTMAELGVLEAMAVQGAQEAMVELGALEAMAELGALEAMAELGALEAMADGLRGPWPRSGPYSRNPFYPPKKISLGKSGVIRSPPGLDTQNSTWHDKTPGPDKQDRTSQRNRFHLHDKGAGG